MRDGDPIPWQFSAPGAEDHTTESSWQLWSWATEHFTARIWADGVAYAWTLETAEPRVITVGEGRAATYREAEIRVKEVLGKSFPKDLGYQRYAGRWSTTFLLQGGREVDVAPLLHQKCLVTVSTPNGTTRTFSGTLEAKNWELHVRTGGSTRTAVKPSHVVSITPEHGTSSASNDWTGMGRVYHGTPNGVCNGMAGFLPDTIDHTGAPCPLHEPISR